MRGVIHSLDEVRRFSYDSRVLRSSQYKKKKNKLNLHQKITLNIIEAKVIQILKNFLCPNNENNKFYEADKHTFDEGTIFLYFNPHRDKFKLLDFQLCDPSDDGIFCGTLEPKSPMGYNPYLITAQNSPSSSISITAFSKKYTSPRLKDVAIGNKDEIISAKKRKFKSFDDVFDSVFTLSGNTKSIYIDSILSSIINREVPTSRCFPEWSIVRRRCLVPEQVKNNFARQVVFGELLAFLSINTFTPCENLDCENSATFKDESEALFRKESLIDETLRFIKCYRNHQESQVFGFYDLFPITSSLSELALLDDRAIHIAKSEIICAFSRSLFTDASRDTVDVYHSSNDIIRDQTYRHRLSRLNYFIVLIERALDVENVWLGSSDIEDMEKMASNLTAKNCSSIALFGSISSELCSFVGDDFREFTRDGVGEFGEFDNILGEIQRVGRDILDINTLE